MISRRQFERLVERVVKRIAEAGPVKAGNFRYDASGNSVEIPDEPVGGTAKTQMPPTMPPQTVPAPRSAVQQQADSELANVNTRNPKGAAPSQRQIKMNAIKKALGVMGNDSYTPQNLAAWYDKLDPADALVATADELAQRFSSGN